MFFRRRSAVDDVREGAIFQRSHPSNFVERAEVVWIGKDHFGIPHVQMQISPCPFSHPSIGLKSRADRSQRLDIEPRVC